MALAQHRMHALWEHREAGRCLPTCPNMGTTGGARDEMVQRLKISIRILDDKATLGLDNKVGMKLEKSIL